MKQSPHSPIALDAPPFATTRRHALLGLAGLVAGLASPLARASATTRLVLPLAPGGAMDVLGRGLAAELGQRLGQNFVVENRAGAGGNLAHEFVAGEKPDGATLLLTSNALVANITLFEGKVRYDPIRSFAPVALVAATPAVIVVRAEGGAADVAALARQARGRGASIGTPGFGNGNHLALVKIQRAQGGDWIHVPYKGAGPAVTGLLGGETDAAIVALPAVASQIQAGKLRALAVLQDQRSAIAPQVPTLTEAGVSIQHDIGWFGLLAPAGTPGATVQRIHRATVDALADERFRAILSKQGFETLGSTPQAFAAQLQADVERFPPLLKSIGAKVE